MVCYNDVVYLASNMLGLNYSEEECDVNDLVEELISDKLQKKYGIDICNFYDLICDLYNHHMNLYGENCNGNCEGFYKKDSNHLIIWSY